ncbi:hypothetical protein D3C71_2245970 [compost metagenome]
MEADVTIYPPLAKLQEGVVEVKNGEHFLDLSGQTAGNCLRLTKVSGTIDISW